MFFQKSLPPDLALRSWLGAGEGFDFVREALNIGFGGAFGLFGFGGGKMEVLHDRYGNAAWENENATCDFC